MSAGTRRPVAGRSPAIAIIGAACRFPGAESPEALWRNVLAGRREFRRVPALRFPLADYFASDPEVDDKTYSDQMAVITGWEFDAAAFDVPPVTVEASDTTHWLALSTAADALKDTGIDLAGEDRSRFGVVLGNSLGGEYARSTYLRYRWPFVKRAVRRALREGGRNLGRAEESKLLRRIRRHCVAPFPRVTEDSLPGTMSNTIAGRICSYFDLGGGGYTVDGACSSSLLAVAQACELLGQGELDLAICGGVDVSLDPYELIGFAKTRALAREDIRPYDARAEGMLPGEGCGIVVLARASTARRRRLRIRALIRGWGVSSDGRGAITAPRPEGQARALQRAYERAGYSLHEVQLLEGHGTATALGDEVELDALLQLLGRQAPKWPRPIVIGSIKGNIGHCKAAAGAAGLIKTMMALERKILPPTAGCERPHRLFGRFERLAPALDGEEWKPERGPRRAGVSAFGFGGSNAHLTLQESDGASGADPGELSLLGTTQATELILLSVHTGQDLRRQMRQLANAARHLSRAELVDLAAQLAAGDQSAPLRMALVVTTPRRLEGLMARAAAGLEAGSELSGLSHPGDGVFAGRVNPARKPRVAALFPGQGTQRVGMGRHLLRRYPMVRDLVASVDRALDDFLPRGVSAWMERDVRTVAPSVRAIWEAELEQTSEAQPAIVAASLSMLAVLEYHGLHPDYLLGHSLGEISALCAAGVFTPEQAVRIAAQRGQAMARADLEDPGAMVQLAASPEETRALIAAVDAELEIACYNTPRETVVSGACRAVEALCRRCARQGVEYRRLAVSCAFHTQRMAPAAQALEAGLGREHPADPGRPLVSSVTGRWLEPGCVVSRLLVEQVMRPVRFTGALYRMAEVQPDLWVEVGPGNVLTRLAATTLGENAALCLPTDSGQEDGFSELNRVLAQAFVLGVPIAAGSLFAHRYHRPGLEWPPRVIVNPCEREPRPRARSTLEAAPASNVDDEKAKALGVAVAWIAGRTGYPRHSIQPWMRLRDDLNLDSIKAMELLQVFTERYGRVVQSWQQWENLPLGELIERFLSATPDATHPLDTGLGAAPLNGLEPGGDWIRRFDIGPAEVPLNLERALSAMEPPSVLVTGWRKGQRVRAVLDELTGAGYAPLWVSADRLVRGQVRRVAVGAVVLILSEPLVPWWEGSPRTAARPVSDLALPLLRLARWCATTPEAPAPSLRLLVLRASHASARAGAADAGAGLLKALRLEEPAVLAKWVRLPSSWSPDRWGVTAAAELARGGRWVEYGYDAAGRRFAEVALLSAPGSGGPPLGPGEVVLATGGARGITRELVQALGEDLGVRLALVGRSAAGEPAVRAALAWFRRIGIEARYYSCDVSVRDSVERLMRSVRREMGPVRGILHGAGVTRPVALAEISEEDWLTAVRTKTEGLANLVRAGEPGELAMLHALSSILGHTGMPRQLDYAFANAWLAGAVSDLSEHRPEIHAATLGYSVWRETGLGMDLGSVDALTAFGVTTLDTAQGVAAYRQELRGRRAAVRRVIAGRLVPELEAVLSPPLPPARSRFLERVLRWIPGVELIAQATLTHDVDLYLADHVFEGTVMFPAVMGIEALVSAAMTCLDRDDLPVVRELELRRPVIVPPEANVVIRVYALADAESRGRVRVALRSEMDGFSEDCLAARCGLDGGAAPPPEPPQFAATRGPATEALSRLSGSLFQGPIFRWLTALPECEPGRSCLAEARIPGRLRYFGDASGWVTSTPYPAARDAFLQTILLMLEGRGLPTAIRELHFLGRCAPGGTVLVRARKVAQMGERQEVDIHVFTKDGRDIEILRGVRVEAVGGRRRARRLQVSELGAEIAARWPDGDCGVGLVLLARVPRRTGDGHRDQTGRANQLAVREALLDLARRRRLGGSGVEGVELTRDEHGAPRLRATGPAAERLGDLAVGITDIAQLSVAVVARGSVGIDLEPVGNRSAEEWRSILGTYGYALALRLVAQDAGDFAMAATCAWTVMESAKKSALEPPPLQSLTVRADGPWTALGVEGKEGGTFLSAALGLEQGSHAVFTVAICTAAGIVHDANAKDGAKLGVQTGH